MCNCRKKSRSGILKDSLNEKSKSSNIYRHIPRILQETRHNLQIKKIMCASSTAPDRKIAISVALMISYSKMWVRSSTTVLLSDYKRQADVIRTLSLPIEGVKFWNRQRALIIANYFLVSSNGRRPACRVISERSSKCSKQPRVNQQLKFSDISRL